MAAETCIICAPARSCGQQSGLCDRHRIELSESSYDGLEDTCTADVCDLETERSYRVTCDREDEIRIVAWATAEDVDIERDVNELSAGERARVIVWAEHELPEVFAELSQECWS